jgi:thiamine transporter
MQEPPHRIRQQQTRIRQMLLVATQVEIPETIQTEQQAEIPEKTPVVTQAEMVDKTPVATQAEIPEKTPVATQVEIVVTPVVIQVETPGTAQVELPVVPPEAKQPSRFFFAVLSGVVFFAAYAPVTIGNKMIDALIYSVTYNGSYLAVEEIITIIVISIPPVKKALDYVKQMANSR